MATAKKRLTSWELKKVLRRGVKWNGELLRSKAVYAGSPQLRLAVVISKKTISGAVLRNRCRRRIRETFHEFASDAKGWDIAVFPTSLASSSEFAKLKSEARKCLDSLLSKQSEFTKRR